MNLVMAAMFVAITFATSASAQVPSATAADVVEVVRDCVAATPAIGPVQVDKVLAAGWIEGRIGDKPSDNPGGVRIFAKHENGARLVLAASGICTAIAKIDMAAATTALDTALAVPRKTDEARPDQYFWFPNNHLVNLTQTGTSASPAVRIGVMHMSEEKK